MRHVDSNGVWRGVTGTLSMHSAPKERSNAPMDEVCSWYMQDRFS
jgi:hypothetical protein